MKEFLLINSPIYWNSQEENEQYLSPLGLGYIATYLEKLCSIHVELLDCVKERKSVLDVIMYINEKHPDFIGINVFTQNYEMVKNIIENIKVTCECFIGGPSVKNMYIEILSWNTKNIFNIIIGEGEFIIPEIVLGQCKQPIELKNGSKYVYRVNQESKYFPKDISNIFLNRKYLKNEMIVNHYGENEIAIITSRGCAFDCAFCGGARSLNKDVAIRIRSEESVTKEIEKILEAYPNTQSIRILDDLFLRNEKSIVMANNIFSKFPQLNWRGMVHVLALAKSIDKVKDLQIGGCRELFIGIESGSESVRTRINKLGNYDQIISVSKGILENGIDLKGYFIFGFPKETEEDFIKTYELAKEIEDISQKTPGKFRTSVFQFRPYHGTKLYNDIINDTGILHGCEFTKSISKFSGRSQFNFDFGNYSAESDEILQNYILKTQNL